MKKDRSYHDLTDEEKARYNKLRAEQRSLRFGVAKPYDKDAYQAKKAEADAMLGLRPEEFVTDAFVHDPHYKVWRGSATHAQRRPVRVPLS